MDKRKLAILTVCSIFLVGGAASAIQFHDPLQFTTQALCTVMLQWNAPAVCTPDASDVEFNADNTDSLINSIYGNGLVTHDDRQQAVQNQMAHLNQSYGVGMTRAKAIGIQQLNNGSTLSTAQNKAYSEINNYYSNIESQMYTRRNREVVGLKAGIDRANEDGMIDVYTTYDCRDGSYPAGLENKGLFDFGKTGSGINDIFGLSNVRYWNTTVELKNGSDHLAIGLNGTVTTHNDNSCDPKSAESTSTNQKNVTLVSPKISTNGINADNVDVRDSDYSNPTDYINDSQWREAYNLLNVNHDNALSNVNGMLQEIYNSYSAGEINLSNVEYGPLESLRIASTNYQDTGLYSYRAASLQQMGLASNESYAFNVSFDGKGPVTGQVFIPSQAWNKTLEAGKTYDVGSKHVEIVYQADDGAKRERVQNNFTIHSMRNPETGATVNRTGVQQVEFYTENVSKLQQQIDRLEELETEYERDAGFGGIDIDLGIGGWISNNLGASAIIAGLLIGLLLVA